MTDNKERERVAKEICGEALFSCAFGCEGLCEDCYDIADWHLKDKETALTILDAKWRKEMADEIVADRKKYEAFYEARGMKKAAELLEMNTVPFSDEWGNVKDKYIVEECNKIIEEANKTLEAEGETRD